MKKIWVLLSLVALVSCERNIDIELDSTENLLVVDAEIENEKPPVVILTRSIPYFTTVDPSVLATLFVRGAEVSISNGTLTHRLKEYNRPIIPGINIYYYSIDSSNLSTAFNGAFNENYTLRINAEGKEYVAETGIPAPALRPDSIFFRPAPQNPDTNKRVMLVKITDPAGLGNFGRYFTKVNGQPFYPGENSVFTDEVVDGTSFEFQLPPGIDRNNPPRRDDNFFFKGDTVILKFCNIDRATYRFWNTWEFAYQSIGNPFAQPNKVIGNVSNGALGAFCGYAAIYDTLIVP